MEKPSETILERRKKCREYHLAHREEILERKRKYYQENKERIAQYQKGRKAKRNAVRRKHYAENKEQELFATYSRRRNKYGGANIKTANAITAGKIVKLPCEVCGDEKAEAHHDDYNKPLAVRWLCKRCHTDWHLNNKPKYVEGI